MSAVWKGHRGHVFFGFHTIKVTVASVNGQLWHIGRIVSVTDQLRIVDRVDRRLRLIIVPIHGNAWWHGAL